MQDRPEGDDKIGSQLDRLLRLADEREPMRTAVVHPCDAVSLGGALFGDRRYGRVFTYHNGAQSYYAVRGFRGLLRV